MRWPWKRKAPALSITWGEKSSDIAAIIDVLTALDKIGSPKRIDAIHLSPAFATKTLGKIAGRRPRPGVVSFGSLPEGVPLYVSKYLPDTVLAIMISDNGVTIVERGNWVKRLSTRLRRIVVIITHVARSRRKSSPKASRGPTGRER